MTDLITAEDAKKLLDECDSDGCLTCEYARSVIALHAQLADAQAAQAMAVERCAEVMDQKWFIEDSMRDAIKAEIRALAPASGVEALAALRAENKRLTDAVIDAEAERDILAAANAVLEAKVAGLVEALEDIASAQRFPSHGDPVVLRDRARAALATQEAGNAQSTPPISPEEAQFNAVRHHERFGPLDEKGNPLDPRRRG